MSDLVPYGVGFLSGATCAVMYKKLREKKNNNGQDTVHGISYAKSDEAEKGDEDEPLTVTQQEAEATYVDMCHVYESISDNVEYTNWPPGAVLKQQEQQQHFYEPIEYPSNSGCAAPPTPPEYANVSRQGAVPPTPPDYANWPPVASSRRTKQQNIYENCRPGAVPPTPPEYVNFAVSRQDIYENCRPGANPPTTSEYEEINPK